ncbi:hypothetical protein LCGC14_1205290 [marine sediment metagenome]|uniref:Uncharacterized protein n=1 Tax=marine sediment metagenome TaxID=412755 RepID=A0A0F9NXX1_9ZZZZ
MNEIAEYRKESAKAVPNVFMNHENIPKKFTDNWISFQNWQPNTDADQMLMVIDLLLKKDKMIVRNIVLSYVNRGTSLFIATMKAFMEWQRKGEG